MSDTTTPIPGEAVERAAKAVYDLTRLPGSYDRWSIAHPQLQESYRGDARAALGAAVPVLLDTERERIATAIEAECKHTTLIGLDVCERCQRAARIARTSTEGN